MLQWTALPATTVPWWVLVPFQSARNAHLASIALVALVRQLLSATLATSALRASRPRPSPLTTSLVAPPAANALLATTAHKAHWRLFRAPKAHTMMTRARHKRVTVRTAQEVTTATRLASQTQSYSQETKCATLATTALVRLPSLTQPMVQLVASALRVTTAHRTPMQ